jgi:ABC-type uncharacterized transport system permease subunit
MLREDQTRRERWLISIGGLVAIALASALDLQFVNIGIEAVMLAGAFALLPYIPR